MMRLRFNNRNAFRDANDNKLDFILDSISRHSFMTSRRQNNSEFPYGKGKILLSLFNLPVDCNVLVAGDRLVDFANEFYNAKISQSLPAILSQSGSYDLILLDARESRSSKILLKILRSVRFSLSPGGFLIIFVENYWSLSNLRRLFKDLCRITLPRTICSYIGFRKILRRTHFPRIREFLGFPRLEFAEEFAEPESPFLEIPHYSNLVEKVANRIGKYKYIHEGFIFICSENEIETNGLFSALRKKLKQKLNRDNFDLHLERFDIRKRGALVLFLREIRSEIAYIARVIMDEAKNEIISKNHAFQKSLHSMEHIPQAIKHKIPFPLDYFKVNENHVYVETLLPGVLAWKVNNRNLRTKIHKSAVGFIFQLNFATRKEALLDNALLNQLFMTDLYRINSAAFVDPAFRDQLKEMIHRAKNYFLGKDTNLVCSHGDYGFGNILVNSNSGKLEGVIDWDTARMIDLPGIDLLNMEIQKVRTEKNANFMTAVQEVTRDLVSGRSSTNNSSYWRTFKIDDDTLKCIFFTCVLRYIVRSLPYPNILRAEQLYYRQALSWLAGVFHYE